ncbi:AMP-dependent synthetase/ligase [Acididesulfobacillus acetoxydans]|uniref:AMP-dependent synthetase/ligase n=1 Tax=Acididesulfobacillus acetoxydans TaxID=1561005 RepID=A0A8S0WNC1_9FIRM|nr:class I adenylate-forming enzyme family protein [Acididesulfobacillus acetoxydans]CAA7601214.1 AMP-dependent synthetase/ligase [Acididesulfobacillus acetoxydans]CEJ08507.1 Long-chain-fatty-acid--CoA ligase [Acididesulfobacillus acetoxydans]
MAGDMDFSLPKTHYSNNLVSSMKMNLAKNPDMLAIVFEDRQETWAQMWERTNRLGRGMYRLGLKKGDRVAMLLNNGFEFPETYVTTTKAGFVMSPVNTNFKAEELAYQLHDCGAAALVTNPEYIELVYSIRERLPQLKHLIVTGESDIGDAFSYEGLIRSSSPEEIAVDIRPSDVHMILYTSGTTGRPKGAVRGYMENFHTGMAASVEWSLRSGDRQLVVTPLYHAAPCAWLLATLVTGGTEVVLARYMPDRVLEAIEKYKVNWTMMVPIMYDRLFTLPTEVLNRCDLSSLRVVISGGAPLHTPTKAKIKQFFRQAELHEFYGSTELGVSTVLRDEDQLRKERCVGKPLQDVELKLFDREGKAVKPGEVGILYSRGLCGFRGYWNNPEATREAFLNDEWATVGDMARQDDEGYYYLVDRAKDMVISGGVNVYPVEIEEVLLQLDALQDAAVIGVPDSEWGEVVKAIVVLKPGAVLTAEALIGYCKEHLARFKVPKSVDFVESIPRTQTGKILKRELRKKYWGDGGIQVS